MILGGDEFLRSQKGNNNAYCQDNEISWFDWSLVDKNSDFLNFFRQIIALLKIYKGLQMRKYHTAYTPSGLSYFYYKWFGKDLDEPEWDDPTAKTLSLYRNATEKTGKEYDFFAILNADSNPQKVKLPQFRDKKKWHRKIDTSLETGEDFMEQGQEVLINPPESYLVNPYSTVILIGL
jgi:glycogen operon protein